MRRFMLFSAILCSTLSALAITVSTPTNGTTVTSPFSLVAETSTCGSVPATAMGYSLDTSSNTTVEPLSFKASVLAGDGAHTLHVKCWGKNGAWGVTDIAIIVAQNVTPPSNAIIVSNLQAISGWRNKFDPATGGTTTGSTSIVASPSLSGKARQFSMSFTNYGGELFSASFGSDTTATHFIYDAQVMVTNPFDIANVEMDMNQVMANGQTVIYGFQCSAWSGTWEYTENAGTPAQPIDHWVSSSAPCSHPKTWAPNVWHHVQIAYSRDDSGNVTYQTVVFDGVLSDINATVPSAFALGWAPTLITNFQLDGMGARGTAAALVDNLTIYRW